MIGYDHEFYSGYTGDEYSFHLNHDGDEMHDEDLTTRQFAEIIGHLNEYEDELL